MNASELDYELPAELIAQHPLERARRLAAARLLARDRRGPAPRLPRPARRAAGGDARRRQRHARRAGADPDRASRAARCCCSSGSAATSGRGSRGRRGGCGRAGGTGRSSCSSTSARGAGACGSRASRPARRRCRRTSPSRSPTPSATRRSTRATAGSAAAPTAGLHFTPELLARLDVERVTLHVGLDTFRPLTVETRRGAPAPRRALRGAARGVGADPAAPSACSPSARRRCACSRRSPAAAPLAGRTELFVTPGFEFRRVDCLLTNFHLPRSTLLALVMAFAGVEETRRLYRARGRGALPLLLLRRRDAHPLRPWRDRAVSRATVAVASSAFEPCPAVTVARTRRRTRRCFA